MFQKKIKRWGWFKILLQTKGFWIKRMCFKEGSTSLQSHEQRDELWLIYVPAGTKHKITGKGDIIEVAIGHPIEEDIRRYDI